ncbi:MAG TPA: cysteine desulfurase family protein, partial [Planctomycetaceae bacterium]|nr:cysteine desulfurase family protein [Planctomycetaceae bacterium]
MIYLDNHATTRVAPEVLRAMLPYFSEEYGNAASVNHAFGWRAAAAVERAREQIARRLNCLADWIVFTSGATEANNLAIKGVVAAARRRPTEGGAVPHFITNAAEHPSVLDVAKRLQRNGIHVTVLPVDGCGRVDPQQVVDAIRPATVLVSVMLANNEVGTLNPIGEIGRGCRERGVLLHCDAVQAVGKIPVDLEQLPVDLLTLSAHKLHGPKGVGALVVRRAGRRIPIEPLFDGGGHEQHLRSGTLPVPLVVGFGAACELSADMLDVAVRMAGLRDRLWERLQTELGGVTLNGHPTERLPNNLNIS